jgi:hypothetical protein
MADHPHTGVGLPRFAQSTLAGTYPIAEFAVCGDTAVPATITLEAFTPLVPLRPVAIRASRRAIFNYTITNTGSVSLDATLVFRRTTACDGVQLDKYGNIIGKGGSHIHTYHDGAWQGMPYAQQSRATRCRRLCRISLCYQSPPCHHPYRVVARGWWTMSMTSGMICMPMALSPTPPMVRLAPPVPTILARWLRT